MPISLVYKNFDRKECKLRKIMSFYVCGINFYIPQSLYSNTMDTSVNKTYSLPYHKNVEAIYAYNCKVYPVSNFPCNIKKYHTR